MDFVNRICPKCNNPNYVVSLGNFSKTFPYKCINCNAYLSEEDFWPAQKDEIKERQHCKDLCAHAPPSNKWPCIDCDMRYHDRAEPPKEEEYAGRPSDPACLVGDSPTIDAVPIKDISEWLAGYAAPPKYALEMFPESEQCLANTRAAAWEHHIRTMIECGLIGRINE